MKTFTFRYDPHPFKSAFESLERVVSTGIPEIMSDSIACKSMEDMMRIMTKARFRLFAEIVESEPDSLSELAKLVDSDPGNVQRDATALQSIGLIELRKTPGQRGTKVTPIALYQRIIFECEPKRAQKRAG